MEITEKIMQFLEEHIPELADSAVKQAYWLALASGSTVLECENGTIVEVYPDGMRKIVKKLAPPTKAVPGQKIELQ